MARPSAPLTLGPDESAVLQALVEHPSTPVLVARQVRIIQLLAAGCSGTEVARLTGTSPQTVCAWRMRFLRQRLAALPATMPTIPVAGSPPAAPHTAAEIPLRPVTLQHIADLVHAHKSTVHRILRRGAVDDSELAKRIRVAARDLGYRPEANHAARQLSLRRFHRPDDRRSILFYLPTPTFHTPFFLRQFTGAMDVLAGSRFDVLVRLSDELSQRQLPSAIARGEVAAVVSQDTPEWLEIERNLIAQLHPTLRPPLIGLLTSVPGTWSVSIDFAEGARQVVAHLLGLGHRRLIAIEQRAEYTAGLRAALAEHGLDPQSALRAMHAVPGRQPFDERIAETLRLLLAAQPDATALLAANDPMALTAIRVLSSQGRPVPRAMSVIGFDDTDPLVGADGANHLTSLALPLEELGRAAAHLAIEPGLTPRRLLLPSALRIRGTTARMVAA